MKREIIYELKTLVKENASVVIKYDGSINTEDIDYPLKIEFEINEFHITIQDFFMHSKLKNNLMSDIFKTTIYGDVKIVKRKKNDSTNFVLKTKEVNCSLKEKRCV